MSHFQYCNNDCETAGCDKYITNDMNSIILNSGTTSFFYFSLSAWPRIRSALILTELAGFVLWRCACVYRTNKHSWNKCTVYFANLFLQTRRTTSSVCGWPCSMLSFLAACAWFCGRDPIVRIRVSLSYTLWNMAIIGEIRLRCVDFAYGTVQQYNRRNTVQYLYSKRLAGLSFR